MFLVGLVVVTAIVAVAAVVALFVSGWQLAVAIMLTFYAAFALWLATTYAAQRLRGEDRNRV